MHMKYYLQTQAPAGNWVDSIGTNDLEAALSHSDYLQDKGEKTRIVTRVDTVVKTRKRAIRKNPAKKRKTAKRRNPIGLLPLFASQAKSRAVGALLKNPAKMVKPYFVLMKTPNGKRHVWAEHKTKAAAFADCRKMHKQMPFCVWSVEH